MKIRIGGALKAIAKGVWWLTGKPIADGIRKEEKGGDPPPPPPPQRPDTRSS